MYRIITIEREYGCGGAAIAAELAKRLGWKLWDQKLTEEIAKEANVDPAIVSRHEERCDTTFHRLARVFWRGSFEHSVPGQVMGTFDADAMVSVMQRLLTKIAKDGNCIIVGRGAPYFLRQRGDVFHVFLYAPRAEKLRRVMQLGKTQSEAEELLDTIDRDRIAFVKRYFDADWPTRCLYHMMINTSVGDEPVVSTVLDTMHLLEKQRTPQYLQTCQ